MAFGRHAQQQSGASNSCLGGGPGLPGFQDTLGVLARLGLSPAYVGGHSVGEVTALAAAGVLGAADSIAVARRRGKLMAEVAGTPGAMTAVVADRAHVVPYSRPGAAAW